MKGINLKKKVNFQRKFGKEGEFAGQPITIIREITGAKPDPSGEIEETTVVDSRLPCQYCNRLFEPDSLVKHQKKCPSVFMGIQDKRPPFHSIGQRLPNDEEFKQQIEALGGIHKALAAGFIKLTVTAGKLNDQWRLQ